MSAAIVLPLRSARLVMAGSAVMTTRSESGTAVAMTLMGTPSLRIFWNTLGPPTIVVSTSPVASAA
jgi:hypothetical protein